MLIFGFFGTFLVCLSFIMLSLGWVNNKSRVYLITGFLGSLILVLSSLQANNIQPALLNAVFAFITVLSLLNIQIKHKSLSEFNMWIVISFVVFISLFKECFFNNLGFINIISSVIGWSSLFFFPLILLVFLQQRITEMKFLFLNFLFASLFCFHLLYNNNYPVFMVELIVVISSLFGVVKRLAAQQQANKGHKI